MSVAASAAPTSPNAPPRNAVITSSEANVQKQWTTRIRNPAERKGPSRRLQSPYGGEVAAQPRDVVAAVVVDDEQAAVRPQRALGFSQVAGVGAIERGPAGDDGVDRFGRHAQRQRPRARRCGDAHHLPGDRHESRQLTRSAADDRDVAPGKRPERLERARNLALDVERAEERVGIGTWEREGEVGHGGRVCDDPKPDANADP